MGLAKVVVDIGQWKCPIYPMTIASATECILLPRTSALIQASVDALRAWLQVETGWMMVVLHSGAQ